MATYPYHTIPYHTRMMIQKQHNRQLKALILLILFFRFSGTRGWQPVVVRFASAFGGISSLSGRQASVHYYYSPVEEPYDHHPDTDTVESVAHLNALVPRNQIQALVQRKSDAQGWRQTLVHALAYFGAALFLPKALSTIAMAFVASFFFCALHECVHRTAFGSRRLNDGWAHVFGWLTLRPAAHYRYYHTAHHRYTGDPQRDSELTPGSVLDLPIHNPWQYGLYLSGLPFWTDAVTSLLRHAAGHCPEAYLTTQAARQHVTREARWYLLLYVFTAAAAAVQWPTTPLGRTLWHYVVQPACLGQVFLRFYLLPEHRGRQLSPVVTENTRTMRTNAVYRTLAWQMPYHQAHHAWPAVPFHQLEQAHALLVQAVGEEDELMEHGETIASGRRSYLYFHWKFWQSLW